jgi:UDP-galactopyranose mutase
MTNRHCREQAGHDLLIVGSGLTGATIARLASDAGYRVLVLERREVVGGNIRDAVHESGIRYGLYGPHYFRTSSRKIWDFVNRFGAFRPFAAEVKTSVDGHLEDWPLTSEYLERRWGPKWQQLVPIYWQTDLRHFEDACLAAMPRQAYDDFVRGYTAKQWGADPRELEPGLAKRFEIRHSGPDGRIDHRLKTSRWQGVPVDGYSALVEAMLANEAAGDAAGAIEVHCGVDYLQRHQHIAQSGRNGPSTVVFTGPIDEFFWFDLGRLRYRAQQRELSWLKGSPPLYPTVQTNNPNPAVPWIRVIEWRHMASEIGPHGAHRDGAHGDGAYGGTLLTEEYAYSPSDPDAYEYPYPAAKDRALYQSYRKLADKVPNVIFAGRLGEYKYWDMDQAIARAMKLFTAKIQPRLEK